MCKSLHSCEISLSYNEARSFEKTHVRREVTVRIYPVKTGLTLPPSSQALRLRASSGFALSLPNYTTRPPKAFDWITRKINPPSSINFKKYFFSFRFMESSLYPPARCPLPGCEMGSLSSPSSLHRSACEAFLLLRGPLGAPPSFPSCPHTDTLIPADVPLPSPLMGAPTLGQFSPESRCHSFQNYSGSPYWFQYVKKKTADKFSRVHLRTECLVTWTALGTGSSESSSQQQRPAVSREERSEAATRSDSADRLELGGPRRVVRRAESGDVVAGRCDRPKLDRCTRWRLSCVSGDTRRSFRLAHMLCWGLLHRNSKKQI